MTKWVAVACLSIAGIIAVFMATGNITANLQEALVENASLRMKVVELEEENKVFHEIFTCTEIQKYYISKELGLGKKNDEIK